MPFKSFSESEAAVESVVIASVAAGTVLKPFHGKLRRFPKDYVVVDADADDLPLPLDDLKSRGFVA